MMVSSSATWANPREERGPPTKLSSEVGCRDGIIPPMKTVSRAGVRHPLILDCQNYESSIESLARAYGTKVSKLERFLSALDLEREYELRSISVTEDYYLVDQFRAKFGEPSHAWDRICWFHLTRVPEGTDFSEGLLPLRLSLEKAWKTVEAAQSEKRRRAILRRLRRVGVPDFQYKLKVGVPLHDGPYAMLVREAAFQSSSIHNHDYLRTPEIVEDICNGFKNHCGESILVETLNALKPCIVKFEDSTDAEDLHLMRVLLYYCWLKCRGEDLCDLANTCFDGRGRIIPRSAIQSIEFV